MKLISGSVELVDWFHVRWAVLGFTGFTRFGQREAGFDSLHSAYASVKVSLI